MQQRERLSLIIAAMQSIQKIEGDTMYSTMYGTIDTLIDAFEDVLSPDTYPLVVSLLYTISDFDDETLRKVLIDNIVYREILKIDKNDPSTVHEGLRRNLEEKDSDDLFHIYLCAILYKKIDLNQ